MLDVFFISMGEEGCEANWQRLLKFAPYAKRVDNITGIYQVHKACAMLSTTDNFYVVDADAWIVDGFNFRWKPSRTSLHWGVPESECVLVWKSINPVNDLEYGYGGVKLFPRQPFLKDSMWDIDLSTTIGRSTVSMGHVSCETRFNVTPKSAWIGAFRECTKLASLSMIKSRIRRAKRLANDELRQLLEFCKRQNGWSLEKQATHRRVQSILINDRYATESSIYSYWEEIEMCGQRKLTWCTHGWHMPNGQYALSGAQAGANFGLKYGDDLAILNQINDWNWLTKEFENVNV